jgi:DNA invertase Pin-like site-specific DNA recombinase
MMQMVGAFAEFERAMIRERTNAGLEQARLEGRVGGRKRKLLPHQEQDIRESVGSGQRTAAQCARLFSVHPSTITRLLQRQP